LFHYEFSELLWGGHLTRVQEIGTVTPAEVAQWWSGLKQAHEKDQFFAGITAFIVAGTKS
jgi:hypothetical protein